MNTVIKLLSGLANSLLTDTPSQSVPQQSSHSPTSQHCNYFFFLIKTSPFSYATCNSWIGKPRSNGFVARPLVFKFVHVVQVRYGDFFLLHVS